MKTEKKNPILYFLIFASLFLLCIYILRFIIYGEAWAVSGVNGNAYLNGQPSLGEITDRNGVLLAYAEDGEYRYSEDELLRLSTVHAVGDKKGNVGTGALSAFYEKLLGYSPISGLWVIGEKTLKLTIDSELNKAAYLALEGKSGCVAVMNYKTGEILCMVSSPSFDPKEADEAKEGAYINRFISSSYTPGSVFKLITLAAAVENIEDLYERTFYCSGALETYDGAVNCPKAHGTMKIEDAFAMSCNYVFASLTLELGGDAISEYAKRLGITESFSLDGVKTASGRYDIAGLDTVLLAWSGVGQYNDMVNPAGMLRLVSAVANGGVAVNMKLTASNTSSKTSLLAKSTADKISTMMNYAAAFTYGRENFPGLDICAKSGTAEIGGGKLPHAWFVGFIENEGYPLAFVAVVENGGGGSAAAGSVISRVLQAAVNK